MELSSPYPDVNIPDDVSFSEFLLDKAKTFGDRVALINEETSEHWTYSDVVEQCYRVASGLHKHGLRKGDTVVLYLENSIEYVTAFFGTLLCGGTVAGIISVQEDIAQLTVMTRTVNPKYIIVQKSGLHSIRIASSDCVNVETFFVVGQSDRSDGVVPYTDLLQPDIIARPIQSPNNDDVALFTYTSGTTGNNKCIKVSHRNLLAATIQYHSPEFGLFDEGKDITLMLRPCTHAYGYTCHLAVGLYHGVTHIYTRSLPGTDKEAMANLARRVEKYKVSVLLLTPARLINMMNSPAVGQYDTSSLNSIVTAGAPLSRDVLSRFSKYFGVNEIRNMFGMSEICMVTTGRRGCISKGIGRLLPNNKAKIVDVSSSKPLGPHAVGELWIKGPTVCLGYTNNEEANEDTFVDGWMKTGDMAYHDEDGYLYVVDRLKELIKYDALPVSPSMIEAVILEHPAVAEVAVVGRPDEVYGELPTAFVVPKTDVVLLDIEIVDLVKSRLAEGFWLHGGVKLVDCLPKIPGEKIARRVLKERLQNSIAKK